MKQPIGLEPTKTCDAPRAAAGCRNLTLQQRAAFTIIELLSAMVVLSVLTASLVPVLRWANLQRADAERRIVAQQEANNAAERLSALPWNELGPDTGKDWKLSDEGAAVLPEGRLTVRVGDETGTPPSRRAQVVVSWKQASGKPEARVQLSAWFPRPPEGRP